MPGPSARTHRLALLLVTGCLTLGVVAGTMSPVFALIPSRDAAATPDRPCDDAADWSECTACGYLYDPADGDPSAGVAPGTKVADLPEDWVCPVCEVGKGALRPYHPCES